MDRDQRVQREGQGGNRGRLLSRSATHSAFPNQFRERYQGGAQNEGQKEGRECVERFGQRPNESGQRPDSFGYCHNEARQQSGYRLEQPAYTPSLRDYRDPQEDLESRRVARDPFGPNRQYSSASGSGSSNFEYGSSEFGFDSNRNSGLSNVTYTPSPTGYRHNDDQAFQFQRAREMLRQFEQEGHQQLDPFQALLGPLGPLVPSSRRETPSNRARMEGTTSRMSDAAGLLGANLQISPSTLLLLHPTAESMMKFDVVTKEELGLTKMVRDILYQNKSYSYQDFVVFRNAEKTKWAKVMQDAAKKFSDNSMDELLTLFESNQRRMGVYKEIRLDEVPTSRQQVLADLKEAENQVCQTLRAEEFQILGNSIRYPSFRDDAMVYVVKGEGPFAFGVSNLNPGGLRAGDTDPGLVGLPAFDLVTQGERSGSLPDVSLPSILPRNESLRVVVSSAQVSSFPSVVSALNPLPRSFPALTTLASGLPLSVAVSSMSLVASSSPSTLTSAPVVVVPSSKHSTKSSAQSEPSSSGSTSSQMKVVRQKRKTEAEQLSAGLPRGFAVVEHTNDAVRPGRTQEIDSRRLRRVLPVKSLPKSGFLAEEGSRKVIGPKPGSAVLLFPSRLVVPDLPRTAGDDLSLDIFPVGVDKRQFYSGLEPDMREAIELFHREEELVEAYERYCLRSGSRRLHPVGVRNRGRVAVAISGRSWRDISRDMRNLYRREENWLWHQGIQQMEFDYWKERGVKHQLFEFVPAEVMWHFQSDLKRYDNEMKKIEARTFWPLPYDEVSRAYGRLVLAYGPEGDEWQQLSSLERLKWKDDVRSYEYAKAYDYVPRPLDHQDYIVPFWDLDPFFRVVWNEEDYVWDMYELRWRVPKAKQWMLNVVDLYEHRRFEDLDQVAKRIWEDNRDAYLYLQMIKLFTSGIAFNPGDDAQQAVNENPRDERAGSPEFPETRQRLGSPEY